MTDDASQLQPGGHDPLGQPLLLHIFLLLYLTFHLHRHVSRATPFTDLTEENLEMGQLRRVLGPLHRFWLTGRPQVSFLLPLCHVILTCILLSSQHRTDPHFAGKPDRRIQ